MIQTAVIRVITDNLGSRNYPVNEVAKVFAELIGKKTFNSSDLDLIKRLGFKIERVYPERGSSVTE